MSYFDILDEEVNEGLAGRNTGIPVGFNRLNRYIGLRKATFFLIGGNTGSGKCLAKGTKVLMYDGTYKKVEDVKIDDLLMSTDSNPTKVIGICHGVEEMFSIAQKRGMTYVANKSHVLSLKPSGKKLIKKFGETLNIDISHFLQLPKWQKDRLYGYKLGINFPEKKLPLDPYMLGLWLGDGSCNRPCITTNVLNNKHIPFEFSRNSRKNRLELLAGLVDTDGYYSNKAGYEIVQKNERLSNDIVWLCRSLGFYTSINQKLATMKRHDGTIYSCPVFRIQIYGAVNEIPCRVRRKQAKINTPNKDNMRGQLTITSIGEGEYYGFELEDSKLFFLEDFTVTHNTSFVDNCFVLNPFDFVKSKENVNNIKLKIIYRSMERNKKYKLAKWLSGKIFLDYGTIIPVHKLLGWTDKMTHDEHDLYLSYRDYIGEIEEIVNIIDAPENPIGIVKEL
jgi:replicative DNA helicase